VCEAENKWGNEQMGEPGEDRMDEDKNLAMDGRIGACGWESSSTMSMVKRRLVECKQMIDKDQWMKLVS
jgi:hypothetical protein